MPYRIERIRPNGQRQVFQKTLFTDAELVTALESALTEFPDYSAVLYADEAAAKVERASAKRRRHAKNKGEV